MKTKINKFSNLIRIFQMEKAKPNTSEISTQFQTLFNLLVEKRQLVTKEEIDEFSIVFYMNMRKKFTNSDECPYPSFLSESYQKSKKLI